MSDKPLFQNMDEQEKILAPQQVPGEAQERVRADEGAEGVTGSTTEPPAAAPVASTGTSPSAISAPPNLGDEDPRTGPGDPNPVADYPMDNDEMDDEDLRRRTQ